MECGFRGDALQTVSVGDERRNVYSDRRRDFRDSLSERRSFREHFLLLSIGGLQRRRVFGAFARSFGHNRSAAAADAAAASADAAGGGAKRQRDCNHMERCFRSDALQTLSVNDERRFVFPDRRQHRRNQLSGQRTFRENCLLLSTGGLQRQRVFGSFARSFGDNGSGAAVGADGDDAKRGRDFHHLERGGGGYALQTVSVDDERGIVRSDRRRHHRNRLC